MGNKEACKKYYDKNKEKVLAQQKIHKQIKYLCECGCAVRNDNISRHTIPGYPVDKFLFLLGYKNYRLWLIRKLLQRLF